PNPRKCNSTTAEYNGHGAPEVARAEGVELALAGFCKVQINEWFVASCDTGSNLRKVVGSQYRPLAQKHIAAVLHSRRIASKARRDLCSDGRTCCDLRMNFVERQTVRVIGCGLASGRMGAAQVSDRQSGGEQRDSDEPTSAH